MSLLLAGACVSIVAGALLQAATGFGFSLLAAPLTFAAVDPAPAVGLLLVLGAEVNLLTLAEGRRPQPLRDSTRTMLAWAAPGAFAGVAVLLAVALQIAVTLGILGTLAVRHGAGRRAHIPAWAAPGAFAGVAVLRALPAVALQIAVTLGILGTLAVRHGAGRRAHVPAWAAGLTAGAMTTSTSVNGPPMLLHLLDRGASPTAVRDTMTAGFLGLSVLGAIALAVTGTPALPDTALVLGLIPAVLAAHLVGRRLFARLAAGGGYEKVLNVLLAAAAVAGLVGVLA